MSVEWPGWQTDNLLLVNNRHFDNNDGGDLTLMITVVSTRRCQASRRVEGAADDPPADTSIATEKARCTVCKGARPRVAEACLFGRARTHPERAAG